MAMTTAHPLADALLAVVGPQGLLLEDDVRARRTQAIQSEPLRARVLVRPKSTAEVSAVLALCHRAACPVVVHGGLTGLVHGADADGDEVIVSLERMNAIEELSPVQRIAVVQAGVVLQRLQEAAQDAGLFFPLDMGSRGSATVGGCVATNAGGNRVIRWGMMRDMVLGVEAVLADGTLVSSMNRVIKNNTGYDLKQLFVGSEGTLGVVTRVVLRLRERPASRCMALVALERFEHVMALLKHMDLALGGGLTAFEVMWPEFYALVTTPPAKSAPPLPPGHGYYVLLESLGADQTHDADRFERALGAALEQGLLADAIIAQSEAECDALWGLRDDVVQMGRHGLPFSYDVSLPLADTEQYAAHVRAEVQHRWPAAHCWFYGHLGDGNLHVVVSVGQADAATHEVVDAIVYRPLKALGGAVSAEHGIGLDKKAWLGVSRNAAELDLMRALKQCLDPKGQLNPGRIFS